VRSRPAATELSVLAPCYNEEANLSELARRVGEVFRAGGIASGELVLVDDGSQDGTWSVIRGLAREHAFVVGRRHAANRGISAAWRTALAASCGRLVCLIDADLQNRPEDILRLLRELEGGKVDLVQGWRSTVGRPRNARYWCSRGFNLLLNAAFSMDLRDNKSGFILCPREVLDDLLGHRGRYFYWHPFIMVAAHHKGYAWSQVETLFGSRRAGKSFLPDLPFATIAQTLVDVGRALVEYRLGPQRHVTAPGLRRAVCDGERSGPAADEAGADRQQRGGRAAAAFDAKEPPQQGLEFIRRPALHVVAVPAPLDAVAEQPAERGTADDGLEAEDERIIGHGDHGAAVTGEQAGGLGEDRRGVLGVFEHFRADDAIE